MAKAGKSASVAVSMVGKLKTTAQMIAITGALAKRLCTGLQIRVGRFDSGTRLQIPLLNARVAKQVDARDLKSLDFGRTGSSPVPGTKG
jgi:phosphatidylglycerophosphate synthase